MHTTRRFFLGLGVSAVLEAVFHPVLAETSGADAATPQSKGNAEHLLGVLACRESAARVGIQYLAQHPQDADAGKILDEFLSVAPDVREALQLGPAHSVHRALFLQYQDDYTCGRTVSIDGWILSATEARICALAALTPT